MKLNLTLSTALLAIFLIISVLSFPEADAAAADSLRPISIKAGLLDVGAVTGEPPGTIEFRALRRIFDILGIPYDILTDTKNLDNYRVIYTAGLLTNNKLSADLMNVLYDYVEFGGTLVSAGETGNKLYPLFGILGHTASRKRYRMSFIGEDSSMRYIDHPREKTISLGNGEGHFYDEVIWSHGYTPSTATVLAIFNDHTAGFLKNRYERGAAYLLGLSYSESVLLPQIGNDYEAQRKYVNSFEPSADVIMLLLKSIYESRYAPYVYFSTIPYARPTALILSHDVDAQTSFVDSLKFADIEQKYGAKSTFFENTKYFTDWMDIGYYNIKENVDSIRELKRRGWDIGSHTVSHYKKFASVEEGDPNVTFETYDPKHKKTVQGEVRVSKELLDRDIPGQYTLSFRAGDLEFPEILIRVLEQAGYKYDSTFSANDVLSAFPFYALKERRSDSKESSIIEIPVTLDDSMGYLKPGTVDKAVKTWFDIVNRHMDNEAITVLLIHPSDTRTKTYKLEAQEKLMKKVSQLGGWMGDLTTFGKFWRDRHNTKLELFRDANGTLVIKLNKTADCLNPAVGFVVGNTKSKRVVVQDRADKALHYTLRQQNNKLYLGGSE